MPTAKVPLEMTPEQHSSLTYEEIKRQIQIVFEHEGGEILMADNPLDNPMTMGFVWYKSIDGVEITKSWEIPLSQAAQEFGKGLFEDRKQFLLGLTRHENPLQH